MRYRIALIPGDGIGPELSDATLTVLDAVQRQYAIDLEVVKVDGGDDCLRTRGAALPEDTIEAIKTSDACLKGPVGETAADVIVRLRIMFDLYANIRPIKAYPNTPFMRPDVDLVIVRENTEGVYRGLELDLDAETAVCLRVISRRASQRIARQAFELARRRGKMKEVTAVHKANVMKKTCGIFVRTCREVSREYPDVAFRDLYVDNAAMQLIKRPHEFDVLVTTNMFGDILSDEAAILVGGLGMAPGANIGDDFALFEPVHGSAPKYAGMNIANPTSMILASSFMLRWLGENRTDTECLQGAVDIENALTAVFTKGVRTRDLGGTATTSEFAAAVARTITG